MKNIPPPGYKLEDAQSPLAPGYRVNGPNGFNVTVIGFPAIEQERRALKEAWDHYKGKSRLNKVFK